MLHGRLWVRRLPVAAAGEARTEEVREWAATARRDFVAESRCRKGKELQQQRRLEAELRTPRTPRSTCQSKRRSSAKRQSGNEGQ